MAKKVLSSVSTAPPVFPSFTVVRYPAVVYYSHIHLYNIVVKDEDIRIKILRILYAYYRDNPLGLLKTEVVINEVGHEENDVLCHMNYLFDAGYIEGKRFKTFEGHGCLERVKITPKGINIVEPPAKLDGHERNVLIDTMIANFIVNVIEEIERANLSEEEKKGLLAEVNKFLTNPYIAPFVGAALLRLLGS